MNEREEVRVRVDDGVLTVGYWPEALTESVRERCIELLDANRWPELYVYLLSAIITDWDLIGDDGREHPHTEAGLRDVPLFLLHDITVAIMSHEPRPEEALWPGFQAPPQPMN